MTPEFSRPQRLDSIGASDRDVAIEADESERAALARRFGLIAIDRLGASAMIRRDGPDIFASGSLSALVVQRCVATGDPVPAAIEESFALRFVPAGSLTGDEIELSEADCDVIEYEGQAIDLGEAAAETLSLALDPFPRSVNADAALKAAGVIGEEDAGPFAALKGLKDRLGK